MSFGMKTFISLSPMTDGMPGTPGSCCPASFISMRPLHFSAPRVLGLLGAAGQRGPAVLLAQHRLLGHVSMRARQVLQLPDGGAALADDLADHLVRDLDGARGGRAVLREH